MKCESCRKNEATVHYKEIKNDESASSLSARRAPRRGAS